MDKIKDHKALSNAFREYHELRGIRVKKAIIPKGYFRLCDGRELIANTANEHINFQHAINELRPDTATG